jgi:hypothetical protein
MPSEEGEAEIPDSGMIALYIPPFVYHVVALLTPTLSVAVLRMRLVRHCAPHRHASLTRTPADSRTEM